MWTLRCRGWLVARSIVAMPLLTIPSSISETWPFRLLTISKLNWMSNFPVMSFRVKSIEFLFFPFTSPSARSFLCSTEVLRLFFPPNRSVCVGVKPPLSRTVMYRQCCVTGPVICQTPMRSSTPTKMISRHRSFYVNNFFDSRSGGT